MRSIKFDDWFEQKPEEVAMGVELELFLFNSKTKEAVNSNDLVNDILSNLPWNIYKDYYPYQLEIRTTPSTSAEEIIAQTKELYKETSKAFSKAGIFIIPAPSITVREGYVYCGLHTHLSYPKRKQISPYFNKAMGLYPFILSLADHTKNFEVSDVRMSGRLDSSKHIGLPNFDKDRFLAGNAGVPNDERKMKDMIISNEVKDDKDRHRLVKPTTLELRVFDTPSLVSTYSTMIHFIMNLGRHIKNDNPIVKLLESNNQKRIINAITLTRRLIVDDRYGVNKVFHMMSTDVCEAVCEYFKIPFSRETQFEFRENLDCSADVNGYLSMLYEGGWLD